MKELLRLGAVLTVLGIAAFGFVYLQMKKGYPLKIGEPAPAFSLPTLDGDATELARLRGRVVLVNLGASWCPPCLEEMPSLQRLHQKLSAEGLVVLGVSADDDEKDIRQVLAKIPVSFPILRDPDGRMANQYRATGYPETYLVDKQGRLQATFIGPREWDSPEVLQKVRRYLR
jgi:peroxiredoxin